MLKDSAHIQMFEAEWKNRKAKRAGRPEVVPLYDMNDAVGVLGHFVSCDYHSVINVCEGLKVRFVDAGHLLGSSSIEMWISENTAEGVEEAQDRIFRRHRTGEPPAHQGSGVSYIGGLRGHGVDVR